MIRLTYCIAQIMNTAITLHIGKTFHKVNIIKNLFICFPNGI